MAIASLSLLLAAASCQRPVPPAPASPADPRMDPLPVQQARTYPETVTGIFISLADFEDSPGGRKGAQQVEDFAVEPSSGPATLTAGGSVKYVYNITRTGAGAMEVVLPVGSELVFRNPPLHDFSGYTLLSFALYSQTLRDDLQVKLVSGGATWTGHRTLVEPGWNTVQIDIARLAAAADFKIRDVRAIRIGFAGAAMDIDFNIDDIMVINNRRDLPNLPPGLQLAKNGLDYRLTLNGSDHSFALSQCPDGLWRWGDDQAVVQMAEPGGRFEDDRERLEAMGPDKVGTVSLLESNAIRLRLSNAWYFPSRRGEWASLAVRRIRWEHTIYADGRWITSVEINNAGGQDIGPLRITTPRPVAWMGEKVASEKSLADFSAGVARWNFLQAGSGDGDKAHHAYLQPGKTVLSLGQEGVFAPGDADKDGFDESQGCYYLAARNGHCRFILHPGIGGAVNPVFRVKGKWDRPVSIGAEGLTVRDAVTLEDGSILFCLKGSFTKPTAIEVYGS